MNKANRITIALIIAAVSIVTLTIQRSGQSQTQQATNRGLGGLKAKPPVPPSPQSTPQQPEDFSKNTWSIPADADKTKNPVEATPESIAKGKEHFLARSGNCVFCHGETGAGNEENLPRLRRRPADLSDRDRMSKVSDGEMFWKISTAFQASCPPATSN